jgi:O-antigen ligase
MSILSLQIPSPLLTSRNLAWLAGIMLVFWAPFWSGQRLPVLILLGVGIFLHVSSRRLFPTSQAERRWGVIFLLLWIPCLLATPFSYDLPESLTLCLVLLLHYWVGIALLHGLRQPGHTLAAKVIGLTLLFWMLDGFIQFAFGRDLFGIPLDATEMRITGPFDGNLHMGLFIVVLMPLLLWPLAKTRPWTAMLLLIPLGAISALAGARTNMVFVLLVALALTLRLPTWKHRVMLLLLSLSPALVIPYSPVLQSRIHVSATALSNEPGQNEQTLFEKLDTTSSGRLIIWESAGHMLRKHLLTGVGPAAFDMAYPNFVTRADDPFRNPNADGKFCYHAHQMYVSVAAETGLIGLSGFLFAIALIVRWYRQAAPHARDAANPYAVSLGVIAFPINSQPVLYSGWWFPIVLLLLCGMLAALASVEDAPKPATE